MKKGERRRTCGAEDFVVTVAVVMINVVTLWQVVATLLPRLSRLSGCQYVQNWYFEKGGWDPVTARYTVVVSANLDATGPGVNGGRLTLFQVVFGSILGWEFGA